jgi:hypothetical protein
MPGLFSADLVYQVVAENHRSKRALLSHTFRGDGLERAQVPADRELATVAAIMESRQKGLGPTANRGVFRRKAQGGDRTGESLADPDERALSLRGRRCPGAGRGPFVEHQHESV